MFSDNLAITSKNLIFYTIKLLAQVFYISTAYIKDIHFYVSKHNVNTCS